MKLAIISVLMTAAISTGLATSTHGWKINKMAIGSPVNISTNNQEQPITANCNFKYYNAETDSYPPSKPIRFYPIEDYAGNCSAAALQR